jgi:hypothetical protein
LILVFHCVSDLSTESQKELHMKQAVRILRISVTACILLATSLSLTAAPPQTGIHGQATLYISYGAPVEVSPGVWVGAGDVQMPVVTSFTIFSQKSGHAVGSFATDANGAFSVSLVPGKYLVVPDTLTLALGCTVPANPFELTVSPKQFTSTSIFYYRDGPCSVIGAGP